MPPENEQNNSGQDFLKEVSQPTAPAMDTPIQQGPVTTYDIPNTPPPSAPPVQEPGQPIFTADDTQDKEDTAEPAPVKPLTDDYKNNTLATYLNMEESGTAWLACQFTKTTDTSVFKYSAEAKAMLLMALEPYKDVIISALPGWVPVMLIYIGLKTDQFMKGKQIIAANTANEAGRNDAGAMRKIATTLQQKGERKNYVLWNDGYYRNDRNGNYIKRDGSADEKRERPSMDDLQKILAVKANNEIDLICNAFDITQNDFARLGIVLKN